MKVKEVSEEAKPGSSVGKLYKSLKVRDWSKKIAVLWTAVGKQ